MTTYRIFLVEDDQVWIDILKEKIKLAFSNNCNDTYYIQTESSFDIAYRILESELWQLLVTDLGLGGPQESMKLKGKLLVDLAYRRCIPTIVVSGTGCLSRTEVANLYKILHVGEYFDKVNFVEYEEQFIRKVNELLPRPLILDPEWPSVGITDPVRVLFLAADPCDSVRLRLYQELRDIRNNLGRSQQRDNFLLESRESVRPGDITQAIFDVHPQIVHFSGHGMRTGELCFEDIQGKTQPVQPDALAKLFQLVSEYVRCVVLNACYAEIQAKAIAQYIPFVIGMNHSISDQASILFSTGFYKALGAGETVEKAYDYGCVEIQLHGIEEHLTPVIFIDSKIRIN
jgi:CHAT domain